ncbi:apolipoprotein N-acyltransferase [Spirochaeta lutea]|nr:apolipoprotein N-acyltransferase [Spirochaeta lutea]
MHRHILSIVASVIVYAASMPNPLLPYGSTLIGLVSLIPLFFSIQEIDSEHLPGMGAVFGFLWSITHYYWLSNFGSFSIWTLGGVSLVYTAYYAVFFPLLGNAIKTKSPFRIFFIPAVWVSFEFLRSIGYLAFPWNLTGYSLAPILPIIQIADVGGVFLVSYFIVLLQSLIFSTLDSYYTKQVVSTVAAHTSNQNSRALHLRTWIFWVILGVLFWGYGLYRINQQRGIESTQFLDAVLIQQNQDSWQRGSGAAALEDIQNLTLESLQKRPMNFSSFPFPEYPWNPHVITWSETSIPYVLNTLLRHADDIPASKPFSQFIQELPAPLLTGAPLNAPNSLTGPRYMNGATILSTTNDKGIVSEGQYGKRRLIPFAEHIPLAELPFISNFLKDVVGLPSSGWAHGPDYQPLSIRHSSGRILAGTPICFEDSFSPVTRIQTILGADLFINLTNNSWSKTIAAQTQHLAAARFRTIETRRPMLRSTNSGVTSYIDTTGDIRFTAPMFEARGDSLRIDIQDDPVMTLHTRYGDVFSMVLIYVVWISILLRREPTVSVDNP